MYAYRLTPRADTQLKRLARRNPEATAAIIRKIRWLAEHAEEIEHQPLAGTPFFLFAQRGVSYPVLVGQTQPTNHCCRYWTA